MDTPARPRPEMPPRPLGGSFAWEAGAFQDYGSWALQARTAGFDIRKVETADFPLPGRADRAGAALPTKWPAIACGARRGGAVIAADRQWIVPLEPETPACG